MSLLLSLIALTELAGATPTSATANPIAPKAPTSERKISCRLLAGRDSRIPQRVCLPAAEWEQLDLLAAKAMEDGRKQQDAAVNAVTM